ncbi:hypothetical protein TIFTF001_030131 [Ficus carica]|uniref:Uncharacterized protein n=1 Tax=Ficus carica TaxID=3494 RepID=A0AA88DSL8_FICCA|nr:hypothetical protein TIFTF001_030131 [Ficus carica]
MVQLCLLCMLQAHPCGLRALGYAVSPLERWGRGLPWVEPDSAREPDNLSRAWGACIDYLVRRCGCPEDPVGREHVARSEWSQASHMDNWRASGPDNKSGSWGLVRLDQVAVLGWSSTKRQLPAVMFVITALLGEISRMSVACGCACVACVIAVISLRLLCCVCA